MDNKSKMFKNDNHPLSKDRIEWYIWVFVTENNIKMLNNVKDKYKDIDYKEIFNKMLPIASSPKTLKYLIENGADDFNKVMYDAASQGELKIVKLLTEAGADINFKFEWDENEFITPLEASLENEHLKIAKYLLDQGAKYDPTS